MRKSTSKPEDAIHARLTMAAVALEFALPDEALGAADRGSPQICFARQVTMYLLNTNFQMSLSRIAELFKRHSTTAGHACTSVEEAREDPVLNEKIIRLEHFLAQSPRIQTHKLEAA